MSTEAVVPPYLVRLRSLLDGTARHFDDQWNRHDGAEPGSIASKDLEADAALGGTWWEAPVTDLQATATVTVLAATHHLSAISRALEPRPLPLAWAPFTLARSCAEISARAWSLLDPDVTTEARVALFANEALYAWHEGHRGNLELRSGDNYQALIDETVQWAQARGLETGTGRQGAWVGKPRLSTVRLLETMLPGLGAEMYANLSPTTHGSLAGMLAQVAHPHEGRADVRFTLTDAVLSASSALNPFLRSCTRLIDYLGWDRDAWTSWETHVRTSMGELWQLVEKDPRP